MSSSRRRHTDRGESLRIAAGVVPAHSPETREPIGTTRWGERYRLERIEAGWALVSDPAERRVWVKAWALERRGFRLRHWFRRWWIGMLVLSVMGILGGLGLWRWTNGIDGEFDLGVVIASSIWWLALWLLVGAPMVWTAFCLLGWGVHVLIDRSRRWLAGFRSSDGER